MRFSTALLVTSLFLASSCGDDDNGDDGGQPGGELFELLRLSGEQEVPRLRSSATGRAQVLISGDGASIGVNVQADGFSTAVTAAHIHLGLPGEAGPVLFPLFGGDAGDVFPAELERTLTADDLTPLPELGVTTMDQAVAAIREGRTYINIHTEENPAGEIRSHVGPVALAVSLSTGQEVPPSGTAATGSGSIELSADQQALSVTLSAEAFSTTVVAAHIHAGRPGENGPVVFSLFDVIEDGELPSSLVRELSAVDLQARPEVGIEDFEDFVAAMLEGRTYVNFHTTAFPDGELRGHTGPAALVATLSGGEEVPPVATAATGTSEIYVRGDHLQMTTMVAASGFATGVTAAHIHLGQPGANGPIIFPLFDVTAGEPFASPLMLVLTEEGLTPVRGAETFTEALMALLAGGTYVNIHTVANPAGEIRGQVVGPEQR